MGNPRGIVLITLDCLRYDRLRRDTTPTLARLGEKGIVFSEAIAPGSRTATSFASIFTSTPPLAHQVTVQISSTAVPDLRVAVTYPLRIRRSAVTLAEVLAKAGYRTAGIHSNPLLSARYGYARGFETYLDLRSSRFSTGDSSPPLKLAAKTLLNALCMLNAGFCEVRAWLRVRQFGPIRALNPPYATAETTTAAALNWLRRIDSEKFFLWVHYMDPHLPYASSVKWLKGPSLSLERYSSLLIRIYCKLLHGKRLNSEEAEWMRRFYDASVRYADEYVRILLSGMEELGLGIDNTVVVVTSDHGELLGEHGMWGHGRAVYEEVIRVPLIICGPGLEGGKRVERQVSLANLAPTLLDLAGVKKPASFLGKSLLPAVEESSEPILIEEWDGRLLLACRWRGYKYIVEIAGGRMREAFVSVAEENRAVKDDLAEALKLQLLHHVSRLLRVRRNLRVRESIAQRATAIKLSIAGYRTFKESFTREKR